MNFFLACVINGTIIYVIGSLPIPSSKIEISLPNMNVKLLPRVKTFGRFVKKKINSVLDVT